MIIKKKLLEQPPVPLTGWKKPRKSRTLFRENGYILTARITENGTVLEIDGYSRDAGNLLFRHFVDQTHYLTYDVTTEKWHADSVETIFTWGYYGTQRAENFDKTVQKFLGRQYCRDGIFGVECYEDEINRKKRIQAAERKRERIRKRLRMITPPLPAGFRRWALKQASKKDGNSVHVKLIQPTGGRFVERIFAVTTVTRGKTRKTVLSELVRGFTKDVNTFWEEWYYGCEYGKAGKNQSFWDRKGPSLCLMVPKKTYFYMGTVSEIGLTRQQEETLRCFSKEYIDFDALRHFAGKYPQIEMLAKQGYLAIIRDFIKEGAVQINKKAKNVRDMFGLTDDQAYRLRELKQHGMKAVRILQMERRKTPEDVMRILLRSANLALKDMAELSARGFDIAHMTKVILKAYGGNAVKAQQMYTYRDYLVMAEVLGMNPHDEIVYRNRRFPELHDAYAEEANRRKTEKDRKARERKFKNIRRDAERNRKIFGYKDRDFAIIVPESAGAIIDEGQAQHHCVGASDTYIKKMNERKSFILFLRRRKCEQEPYYTIECTESEVLQMRAAFNRQPDIKKIRAFMSKVMKHAKKEIARERKEALAAAG